MATLKGDTFAVHHERRDLLEGQGESDRKGTILWLTGLSASGKSSLAKCLFARLSAAGHRAYVLDGDALRRGLTRDLGFSPADREENIRRIGEVAKLFSEAGVTVLVAVIAPYRRGREFVRQLVRSGTFVEIWCRCPIEVCERRDPKGLYKRARAGKLEAFTGVSAPYEEPLHPELVIDTDQCDPEAGAQRVLEYLVETGVVSSDR